MLTPASIDRDELCSRDMVVVDKDAKVIESLSNLNPTSETLMHLKIYDTQGA